MKRALAERAKQSLHTSTNQQQQQQNKLPFEHQQHRTPTAPQHPPAAVTSSQIPTSNSGSSNAAAAAVKKEEAEQSRTAETDEERPTKIPRVEKKPQQQQHLSISVAPPSNANMLNHHHPPPPSKSPKSPRVSIPPKKKVVAASLSSTSSTTNAAGTKRRFSVDSAANTVPTPRSISKTNDDTNFDSDSAFYLKHQNRALATELKDLQFSVQQLQQERSVRRQQTRSAYQAVNALCSTWDLLEQRTIGTTTTTTATALPMHSGNDDPPSTGTGDDSIEWTRALQNALIALGKGGGEDPPSQQQLQTDDDDFSNTALLEQAAANIAARAKVLQECLSALLLRRSRTGQEGDDDEHATAMEKFYKLQNEMAVVTARCSELQAECDELKQSQAQIVARERRIRRNIYRMAAGMLTPEQVVQTVEGCGTSTDDSDQLEAAVALEKQQIKSESAAAAAEQKLKVENDGGGVNEKPVDGISSAQVEEFRAKIASLELTVSNAEKSIQDLNSQVSDKERRITDLSKRQLSEEDAAKLESLESTMLQLKTSQTNLSQLRGKLSQTQEKWAQALGNEKAALTAVDELISKFNKRWSELAKQQGTNAESEANDAAGASADTTMNDDDDEGKINAPLPEDPIVVQSREITQLQHKLSQALENVRQSESTRQNLKVALAMNASLQVKLDEVKTKYAAVQASRSSSTSSSSTNRPQPSSSQNAAAPDSSLKPTTTSGNSSSKEKDNSSSAVGGASGSEQQKSSSAAEGSSGSSSRSDRLHREYRKVRKELAAMTASKEAAKAKYERAEKERETLVEANVRLLKQISEKDEMNAKSLSTILHLKSLTEKLSEEKDTLEQQAKSASQLALAARLATNAKERVSEEIVKEKKALEDRVAELEKRYESTKAELDRVSTECSESSGKMAMKDSELANALKRSDELVTENEQKREEIRKLVDIVNKAEREASEAKERLANAVKSGAAATEVMSKDASGAAAAAVSSSFTVDQLKTQVSVLKSRLACPVCHYRDKECIILRCRHMHCKQCVDERISNRSRKCPTCNVKFSENDVGDVWLN